MRDAIANAHRVVVKVGSSSLTARAGGIDPQRIERLVEALTATIARMGGAALELEAETGWEFKGVDVSLAPYPDDHRSVAALVERLGPEHTGQNGTLAATALLTNVLKAAVARSGVRSTGLSRMRVMSNPTTRSARSTRSSALSNSQARSPAPHQGARRA